MKHGQRQTEDLERVIRNYGDLIVDDLNEDERHWEYEQVKDDEPHYYLMVWQHACCVADYDSHDYDFAVEQVYDQLKSWVWRMCCDVENIR